MPTTLTEYAMAATYEDVATTLDRTVARFARRHGLNRTQTADLRAEADLRFLSAYWTFDGKSRFTTWLYLKVWKALQEVMRTRIRQDRNNPRSGLDVGTLPEAVRPEFDPDGVLASLALTRDGRHVVRAVLSTADDGTLSAHAVTTRVTRELVLGGWTPGRARAAFADARQAFKHKGVK